MDELLKAFFELERVGYTPILLDGDGKALHEKELLDSDLYRHAPRRALETFESVATGVGIIACGLATLTGPANPVWDRRPLPTLVGAVFPPMPSFDALDGSGARVYLFTDWAAASAPVKVGAYTVRCFTQVRDVLAVPPPDTWVAFNRRLRLLPMDFILATKAAAVAQEAAVECTPQTASAA